MATSTPKAVSKATKQNNTFTKLHTWNTWLAVAHAVQGVVILLLSATKLFPLQTGYLTLNPLATETAGAPVLATASRQIFDINLAYVVAAFFFMSAIAHAVVATIYRKRYETDLQKGVNRARWIEYAFSASTMIIAIGVLSGIVDVATLLSLFALVFVMNLTGLAMEVYNQGKTSPNWLVYIIGCIAGIVPWLAIGLYLWAANVYGSGDIPAFVYWIYVSIFLFFNAFAVNMYLQYKKIGPWKDYLYGERMYMILSLVAKSLLAWQVFAGALRP